MAPDDFQKEYLELLASGQEFDLYGYKPAGILADLQDANPQVVNIIKMRADKKVMSTKRCHKVERSKHLWQLTTDGGARFLYFQDGPRRFVFVLSSGKVKQKKFHNEIAQGEQRRNEYLKLKEGKVR